MHTAWKIFVFCLLACLTFIHSGCKEEVKIEPVPKSSAVYFDVDSIKKRGKLILLTENSASTYFLYRNHERGFDYEMVQAFAKHLGVKLEVR